MRQKRRSLPGLTLTELLVVIGLLALITGVAGSMIISTLQIYNANQAVLDDELAIRTSLLTITREARTYPITQITHGATILELEAENHSVEHSYEVNADNELWDNGTEGGFMVAAGVGNISSSWDAAHLLVITIEGEQGTTSVTTTINVNR